MLRFLPRPSLTYTPHHPHFISLSNLSPAIHNLT